MSYLWIFTFCILDGVTCDMQTETMPNYEACIEAQEQFAEDHRDEDYVSVCKPVVEIRA